MFLWKCSKKKNKQEAGEVVQQLRALNALAEDLDFVPSTNITGLQLTVTPLSGDPTSSSGLHYTCIHMVHLNIHSRKVNKQINTYKKILKS